MSEQDLLTRAADVLARSAEGEPIDPPSRAASARAIAAMTAALQARARARRRRTWMARGAIAASFVLMAVGGARVMAALHAREPSVGKTELVATGRRLSGTTTAWREGKPIAFEAATLRSGDRVTTAPDARAEIALSTGTSVVLAPAADVTFTHVGAVQVFDLGAGAVNARVAKLHENERLLVRTRDVEVEVRGTVFEVAIVPPEASCGEGTPTRVRVHEGVVVVRNHGVEARVAAGEAWPAGCSAVASAPPTPSAAPAAIAPTPDVAPSVAPSVAPPSTPVAIAPPVVASPSMPAPSAAPVVDTLAAKNDLFASALAARRRGDLRASLAGFESYLAQYPSGELVESASAQRMSLLAKLDPARASIAARDYLARWPAGFARTEAESLLSPKTSASATP